MASLNQWKINLKAENPSLTNTVDGVTSTLSTEEYNATIDRWAQVAFDQECANYILDNNGEDYIDYDLQRFS
jgi:hypothetical protein